MPCVISSPSTDSGKTTLSLLISCWAFSKGLKIQTLKVVPNSFSTSEYDVSKLLGSSRGNTSPLFENSIKIALQIFNGFKN